MSSGASKENPKADKHRKLMGNMLTPVTQVEERKKAEELLNSCYSQCENNIERKALMRGIKMTQGYRADKYKV